MENQLKNFARAEGDNLSHNAPTPAQGKKAGEYAQSDNFLSPEERTAILKKDIEANRPALETRLAQIGYTSEFLNKHPKVEEALFSGKPTQVLDINVSQTIQMSGRLRIAMTENGPELRFTPQLSKPLIPDEIRGLQLSSFDKQKLEKEGALDRPFMIPGKDGLTANYLRLDRETNTLELWKVKPEQLPSKLLGIDLTRDQQLQLVSGHPLRLTGLLDKQNEPFSATVSLSGATKGFQFANVDRQEISLKPDAGYKQQVAQNNEGAKTDQTRGQEIRTGQTTTTNNDQQELMRKLLNPNQEQWVGTPKMRPS